MVTGMFGYKNIARKCWWTIKMCGKVDQILKKFTSVSKFQIIMLITQLKNLHFHNEVKQLGLKPCTSWWLWTNINFKIGVYTSEQEKCKHFYYPVLSRKYAHSHPVCS